MKKLTLTHVVSVWLPLAFFYLAASVFPNGVGDTPPLLCYLCVTFLIHFKYRAVWRILLFGYELVPGKEKLEEGTVVILIWLPMGWFKRPVSSSVTALKLERNHVVTRLVHLDVQRANLLRGSHGDIE
ncbi:hypothetical protein V8E55_012014 [Tylopilus felleus]